MRAAEGWHFRYGEPFGGSGSSSSRAGGKDEVY
jgi:hypothetical protein